MRIQISKDKRNSAGKRIILVLFGLFLSIVFLEIALRAGGAVLLFLHEHRNRISIRQKGNYRILCLGESTTALGGKHSYPYQLEGILNQKDIGIRFSVINEGVIASHTEDILIELENNLNKYSPDMIITMMGVNDVRGTMGMEDVVKYENDIISKTRALLKSFKIYKLIDSIKIHILAKAKEKETHKLKEQKATYYKKRKGIKQVSSLEEELKEAIHKNLNNYRAYLELGRHYWNKGKHDKTEEILKKGLEMNPDNVDIYTALGWYYWDKNNYDEAGKTFFKAVGLNQKNKDSYLGLATYYAKQEEYDKAVEMLNKASKVDQESDMVHLEFACYYQGQINCENFEERIAKQIEMNKNNDMAYGLLAYYYKGLRKYELAEECFRKANKLRLEYYCTLIRKNYQKLKEIVLGRGMKLICVQYPVRSVESLKKIFDNKEGIIFVDNEKVFKKALEKESYNEYFKDIFGGDFGHCTAKGNRLLAENIANTVLREVLGKK